MVNPILWLVLTVIDIYFWIILATVIMSWLVAFDVINLRNAFVYNIAKFLDAVTRPVLAPFQKICTPMHSRMNADRRTRTLVPVDPSSRSIRSA